MQLIIPISSLFCESSEDEEEEFAAIIIKIIKLRSKIIEIIPIIISFLQEFSLNSEIFEEKLFLN